MYGDDLSTERPNSSVSDWREEVEDAHDVVFTFYMETWTNAVGAEMYMTGPRLLATLMSEPSVRRLLVANPYRSTPIQWVRRLCGQRAAPFPRSPHRDLVNPRRIRRSDPTSVRALERVYSEYDRVLEVAAGRLGAVRPAVITTSPFVAGYSTTALIEKIRKMRL